METKVCRKCGETKEVSEFTPYIKRGKPFLHSWCRSCKSETAAKRQKELRVQANPEKYKQCHHCGEYCLHSKEVCTNCGKDISSYRDSLDKILKEKGLATVAKDLLDQNGYKYQIVKLREEFSELLHEVSSENLSREDVLNEITDLKIVLGSIICHFQFTLKEQTDSYIRKLEKAKTYILKEAK